MGSHVHQEDDNYNDINNNANKNRGNPRTLCDWVRQFRLKKTQMKRKLKLGGDLRVCAILTTALMRSELELKRKQQERFQRWLELQAKFENNNSAICDFKKQMNEEIKISKPRPSQYCSDDESDEIKKLWKCELSDLDNFLRSISNTTLNKKSASVPLSSSCRRCSPLLTNSDCSHTTAGPAENHHGLHRTSSLPSVIS